MDDDGFEEMEAMEGDVVGIAGELRRSVRSALSDSWRDSKTSQSSSESLQISLDTSCDTLRETDHLRECSRRRNTNTES